jgi:hypothetical protein
MASQVIKVYATVAAVAALSAVGLADGEKTHWIGTDPTLQKLADLPVCVKLGSKPHDDPDNRVNHCPSWATGTYHIHIPLYMDGRTAPLDDMDIADNDKYPTYVSDAHIETVENYREGYYDENFGGAHLAMRSGDGGW